MRYTPETVVNLLHAESEALMTRAEKLSSFRIDKLGSRENLQKAIEEAVAVTEEKLSLQEMRLENLLAFQREVDGSR